jgi:hypothetical protein
MKTLLNKYKGQNCYIVGMGPSLLKLKKESCGDGIIIAIYDSIVLIESLGLKNTIYAMQKDRMTGIGKFRPKKATLLLHAHESGASEQSYFLDYKPRIIWDNKMLGLNWDIASGPSAVHLAKFMGCKKIYMLAFDSCVNGDLRRCQFVDKWQINKVNDGDYHTPGYKHEYLYYCDCIKKTDAKFIKVKNDKSKN